MLIFLSGKENRIRNTDHQSFKVRTSSQSTDMYPHGLDPFVLRFFPTTSK